MLKTFQAVATLVPATLYQGDNIQTLVVLRFIIANTDTNNQDFVNVYLVAPGGTPALTNAIIANVKIAAGTYIEGSGGIVVPPKWRIMVSSNNNPLIICTMSGELTGNPPNQFGPG